MPDQGGKSPLRALQRLILPGSVERNERQRREAQARSLLDSVRRKLEEERREKHDEIAEAQAQGRVRTYRCHPNGQRATRVPKGKARKLRRKRDKTAVASRRRNRLT